MALKSFWNRLTGRGAEPEIPPLPAPDPAPPPAEPVPAPWQPEVGAPRAPEIPPLIPSEPEIAPPTPPDPSLPQTPPLPEPGTVPPPEPEPIDVPPLSPADPPGPAPEPEPVQPSTPPPVSPVSFHQEAEEEPRGFFARLKAGLSRSTQKLTEGITGLFTKRKLDDEALEELEETLITADLGVSAARRIVAGFRKTRFGKEVSDEEVKSALAEEIAAILAPAAQPLVVDTAQRPFTVLVVGVNGVGKTTTIAKLGQQWREEGRSVIFAAGDTFRAAAVEQLQVWGDRVGAAVVAPAKQGADSAGLAYDALQRAQAEGTDILLIDTAGRLHNKSALMEELRKVIRTIRKLDASAPHAVLLVLDATTGQNAIQQTKVFKEMVDVSGLVVTKLDGSAKGGVVVALAQEFGLPVHAVGVGEKAADLRPFDARDFSRSLVGLD